MATIITWYVRHEVYINFIKDIVFAVGAVATFYGFFKLLQLFAQRKTINKRQEMENDAKLHSDIYGELKDYVQDFGVTPTNLRDIGIRLLYIKNYPYNLDNDGFRFMLFYYFLTEHHQPAGYISGKGIYVLDYIRYFGDSFYVNPRNGKWFIDKKGRTFKSYKELEHEHLLKRIPFANIYGYDFNSDWADKGEPVFYTKYKYTDWKLYADDLEVLTSKDGAYPLDRVSLQKGKRAKKIRTQIIRIKNRLRSYLVNKRTSKIIKQQKR